MTQLPGHKRTDECRFKNMYADDSNLLFIIGIVTYATVLRESNIISGPKTFFAKQIYFEGVFYIILSLIENLEIWKWNWYVRNRVK